MVFFEDELRVKRTYATIENPKTIGEHLKKRRLGLKLLQKDLASILGVTEDCITNWENNRNEPQISYHPKVISFLGYNPFPVENETMGGRVRAYRIIHGLTQEDLAVIVGVNESTIFHWERGTNTPHPRKMKLLEEILNKKELSG